MASIALLNCHGEIIPLDLVICNGHGFIANSVLKHYGPYGHFVVQINLKLYANFHHPT